MHWKQNQEVLSIVIFRKGQTNWSSWIVSIKTGKQWPCGVLGLIGVSFLHSLNKYFLSTYSVPGIALGSGDKSIKEKDNLLWWTNAQNQGLGCADGVGWGGKCCEGSRHGGRGTCSSVLAILGTWRRPVCGSSCKQVCGGGSLTICVRCRGWGGVRATLVSSHQFPPTPCPVLGLVSLSYSPKFSEFCFCLWVPHLHPPPLSEATAEVKQGSWSVLGWGSIPPPKALFHPWPGPISTRDPPSHHSRGTGVLPGRVLALGWYSLYVLNILVLAPLLTSLVALSR